MSENRNREPFVTIRAIATQPALLEFSRRLRNDLASGEEARRIGWASEMWDVLRELWAAMGRIGGTIPPRPALLNQDGFVPVLRGLPESFYQDALRAVDGVVQWCESKKTLQAFANAEPQPIQDAQPRGATTGGKLPGTAEKKTKKSTRKGEGRDKLIAALTKHHKYADGGSLNLEPIGNNELARAAGVGQSTASEFFTDAFKGYGKYRTACQDSAKLTAMLKLLNGEFSPYHLMGSVPPGEKEREDE